MNAPTILSPAIDALDRAQVERALRLLLNDLIGKYRNPETGLEAGAITAARGGRPAYWRRTGYSNSAVALLTYWSNALNLAEGLRRVANHDNAGTLPSALLDALIPLNMYAANELQDAKTRAYWDEAPGARGAA